MSTVKRIEICIDCADPEALIPFWLMNDPAGTSSACAGRSDWGATVELQKFYLALLWRPADHPTYSAEELATLQKGHLAFYDELRRQGTVAMNGPIRDAADESLRGIGLYTTATAEEAMAISQGDPMVQAGWLRIEVTEFWTQKRGDCGIRNTDHDLSRRHFDRSLKSRHASY